MKKVYSAPTVSIKTIQVHTMLANSVKVGTAGSYEDNQIGAKDNKGGDVWGNGSRGW